MDVILWLVSGIAVFLGVAGTIIPALPGTPLIFAGAFLIAWWHDFRSIGIPALTFLGILAALGVLVDLLASSLGAKRVGASFLALVGATIGSLIGIFFSLPGLIIGPFVGAYVGELCGGTSLRQAMRVGLGTWAGLLFGTVCKVAVAVSMVGFMILSLVV